jgi:hypothetical protein
LALEEKMTTLSVIVGLLIWAAWFALYRNYWVFQMRIGILQHDVDVYDRLPSYETMFFKFWIWDINKFLKQ